MIFIISLIAFLNFPVAGNQYQAKIINQLRYDQSVAQSLDRYKKLSANYSSGKTFHCKKLYLAKSVITYLAIIDEINCSQEST